jgi:hypothetical protein
MKKIFTLIAMAAMALGASAQTEWRPSEEAPAAGSSIIKDDLLKVATVFATTCSRLKDEVVNLTPVTYGGKTFETYMQIRVDAAPTADNPTGTDKGGSTPLVITAKKNVDLTVYYRRQAANDAYAENDGKDMKLIDQSKPSAAIAAVTYETFDIDGAYANAIKVFKLEEGKVYTLWARGTTGRLYGLDYVEGTGAGGGGGEAGDGTFMISFDGMSAANKLEFSNGFTLQITGNETKTIGNGKNLNINGTDYQSMKVSNGAQNTLTLPAGKVAKDITFYSYVNKDAATDRDSYWKEVAGINYDATTSGGLFQCFNTDLSNPDKRTYDFGENRLNAITFTNTGEQCCYVIEITIAAGEVVSGIENVKATVVDLNAPAYNLAGQKVSENYKGVVIKNGRKMIQK